MTLVNSGSLESISMKDMPDSMHILAQWQAKELLSLWF